MNKEEFINNIFLALLVVIFLKIFDAFFSLNNIAWQNLELTGFFYIYLLIMILSSMVQMYPKIINLSDERLKILLRKFVIWGWIIWFFLFFMISFISTCRLGGFPGLKLCAQNISSVIN